MAVHLCYIATININKQWKQYFYPKTASICNALFKSHCINKPINKDK